MSEMLTARAIPSFPGYYASPEGRLFSIAMRKDGSRLDEMSPCPNTHGYLAAKLQREGRQVTRSLHVLVAEAWHGRRPPQMEVRHLDGNRLNNHIDNLRYGTKSENSADTVRHGRVYTQKLDEAAVREIRALCAEGKLTKPEISRKFGVSDATIYQINRRHTWKHVN